MTQSATYRPVIRVLCPLVMEKLEEQIAYLTRMMDDLSDMIAHQQGEIATLNRRVHMLMQREGERDAQGTGGVILGDERPPHY